MTTSVTSCAPDAEGKTPPPTMKLANPRKKKIIFGILKAYSVMESDRWHHSAVKFWQILTFQATPGKYFDRFRSTGEIA